MIAWRNSHTSYFPTKNAYESGKIPKHEKKLGKIPKHEKKLGKIPKHDQKLGKIPKHGQKLGKTMRIQDKREIGNANKIIKGNYELHYYKGGVGKNLLNTKRDLGKYSGALE